MNLVDSPVTVVFIHRWFAFVGFVAAIIIYEFIRRIHTSPDVLIGIRLLAMLVVLQIMLGLLVLLSDVQIAVAYLHQVNAIALFTTTVYMLHRLHAADRQALA